VHTVVKALVEHESAESHLEADRICCHCRVGTGHSDAERKAIADHLAGNLQVQRLPPKAATCGQANLLQRRCCS
jgi:hypothetical protein